MNLLITLHHHFNLKYCNLLEYTKTIKLFLIIFFEIFFRKTLINNIPYLNIKNSVSGNITTALSDHLPQFFLMPDFFSNSPPSKYNLMTQDWKNFDSQGFLEDFNKTNWNESLPLNKNIVNVLFNNYLDTISKLSFKLSK